MLKPSLAPVVRALVFFGLMGTVVTGLTFGAELRMPADQSSMTVALAKGERGRSATTQFAAVEHADRARSAAKRTVASPSQQAMADGPATRILR